MCMSDDMESIDDLFAPRECRGVCLPCYSHGIACNYALCIPGTLRRRYRFPEERNPLSAWVGCKLHSEPTVSFRKEKVEVLLIQKRE